MEKEMKDADGKQISIGSDQPSEHIRDVDPTTDMLTRRLDRQSQLRETLLRWDEFVTLAPFGDVVYKECRLLISVFRSELQARESMTVKPTIDPTTAECACCHQIVGVSQAVLQAGQELCQECSKGGAK